MRKYKINYVLSGMATHRANIKSNMARVHKMPQFLQFLALISIVLCCFTGLVKSANLDINEYNWKEMLKGEWMVEL